VVKPGKLFSWATVPASTGEKPTHLQRRLALYGFLIFFIAGVWFLSVMAAIDALSIRGSAAFSVAPFNVPQAVGAALGLLGFFSFRWGKYSEGTLRVGEVVLTVGSCACWTGMGFSGDPHVHSEFFILLAYALTIMVHSALVPGSRAWTLLLSCFAAVPVLIGTHLIHLRPDVPHPLEDRLAYLAVAAAWCISAIVLSTVNSQVICGLRRQAERAMQLGQYHLMEKLGQGGMGVVYEARHSMLRRPTAIKLLAGVEPDAESLIRFEREVQLTAKLSHPNVVSIYDFGRTPDGVFYYAMEYLDGPTLQQLVDTFGPVPPERTIHILTRVCGALAAAHGADLIHRDIKPANIVLTHGKGAHDEPKVLDFGLVKEVTDSDSNLTRVGHVAGTPLYVAPEMVLQGQVDARSDLYAVGAVAYFMLTGTTVFSGPTAAAVCACHARQDPEPPSHRLGRPIPADLEAIVLQCLAKAPQNRPPTATALCDALQACENACDWKRSAAEEWWDEYTGALTLLREEARESIGTQDTMAIDLGKRALAEGPSITRTRAAVLDRDQDT